MLQTDTVDFKCSFSIFYRMCKRLNLSGGLSLSQEVVEDPKKKKRQPKSVRCERCGLPLRDKYVLKRHVSFFFKSVLVVLILK